MLTLTNPTGPNPALLHRIVTDHAMPRGVQRLAWASLKSAQGHPVRQARLAEMALAQAPDRAETPRRAAMLSRLHCALAPQTGGDAA